MKFKKMFIVFSGCMLSFYISNVNASIIQDKDSTNIGNIINCNNFIVHKQKISEVGCPSGLDNSYKNQKGYINYNASFVGLDKEIDVDFSSRIGGYKKNNINANSKIFHQDLGKCNFTGINNSHSQLSTSTRHQMFITIDKDNPTTGCYKPCNKIEDKAEQSLTKKCPNSDKTYNQKIKYQLEGLGDVNNLMLINNKYYLTQSHCDNLFYKEVEVSNDSNIACVTSPEEDKTNKEICEMGGNCLADLNINLKWKDQNTILDLWLVSKTNPNGLVGYFNDFIVDRTQFGNIVLDVEDVQVGMKHRKTIGKMDNISIDSIKNAPFGKYDIYIVNFTDNTNTPFEGSIIYRKNGKNYKTALFDGYSPIDGNGNGFGFVFSDNKNPNLNNVLLIGEIEIKADDIIVKSLRNVHVKKSAF